MEAITQMAECRDGNVEISNYVLRDVSIKKALVTPDDDSGIEVLLNMRPSIGSEGEAADGQWWDFNVSSVDQGGLAKDHMTGSIAINARATRPEATPHPESLNRRASGREWNQALRAVGFDYGPTFADMTDVNFNGKDHVCTCRTTAKVTAGGGANAGESRHVLHPASVDSCLQLMIASIYAGRTGAMGAGAVPVQVDQVTVWKPTASQLSPDSDSDSGSGSGSGSGGRATALSFTSERGLRSFNCGSQLVANDGRVLMEIENMRCTLYEAAVPQTASAPARPMTYGEMAWRPDVDSLGLDAVDGRAGTPVPLAHYLELAAFKNAGVGVLDLDGTYAADVLARLPELAYTVAVAGVPEGLEDIVPTHTHKNARLVRLDEELQDLTEKGLKKDSFDLVLGRSGVGDQVRFRELLRAGGSVITVDDGGMIARVSAVSKSSVDDSIDTQGKQSGLQIQVVYRGEAPGHLLDLLVR